MVSRFQFWSLVVPALTVSILSAAGNAQEVKPEWTVFRLVDENDAETTQGSAVLVHSTKGIFLTAKHVVMHPDAIRIVVDDNRIKFRVIASGDNIDSPADDWAILMVDDSAWGTLSPAESNIVYDPSDFVGNTRLITTRNLTTIPNYGSHENIRSILDECDENSVLLVEVNGYDKGDSGSPLFFKNSEGEGVIATTSGWAPNGKNAGLVKFFLQLKDGNDQEIIPNLTESEARKIIKDKLVLKVVPTKCVIDSIVNKIGDYNEIFSNPNEQTEKFIGFIDGIKTATFDAGFQKKLAIYADRLRTTEQSWIDYILIWEKFYSESSSHIERKVQYDFTMMTLASISQARLFLPPVAIKFNKLFQNDPAQRWSASRLEKVKNTGLSSPVLQDLVEENAHLGFSQFGNLIAFQSRERTRFNISPDAKIEVGATLVDLLNDKAFVAGASRETLSVYTDLAATYLSEGVEDNSVIATGPSSSNVERGVLKLKALSSSSALPAIGFVQTDKLKEFRDNLEFKNDKFYNNRNIIYNYDGKILDNKKPEIDGNFFENIFKENKDTNTVDQNRNNFEINPGLKAKKELSPELYDALKRHKAPQN